MATKASRIKSIGSTEISASRKMTRKDKMKGDLLKRKTKVVKKTGELPPIQNQQK